MRGKQTKSAGASLENFEFRTEAPDAGMLPDGVDFHAGVIENDRYYKARMVMDDGSIRMWCWQRDADGWERMPYGPQLQPAVDEMLRSYTTNARQ